MRSRDPAKRHFNRETSMGYLNGKVFQYILIAITCFIFYGNTIQNDYAFDDAVVITENRFTQKGVGGISEIFGNNTFRGSYGNTPTVERYRPLSVATFAIEHEFFGQAPHISHFNNILLLILTSLVLYTLLLKVFGEHETRNRLLDFPLVVVLLFIAHPVHTETVANIKGRDEILALAGALSATLHVLKYLDTHKYRHLVLGFLLFSVALFSKENAITFLAIVPLTAYYYRQERWTQYLRSLLPLILASAVFLGVRRLAIGGAGPLPPEDILTEPFAYATLSERFATILYTFGVYLRLLIFPHPLTIDYYPYHIQLANWKSIVVWLSILVHVSLALYALWNLRSRSVVAYGILFYMFTLSIVSNLPFSIGTFMSERFIFIPSLGFVIIVAWLLSERVFPATKHPNLMLLAISFVCLLKTYNRNEVWKDDFTLFTTDVGTSSNSIKANLAATVTLLTESQRTDDTELNQRYRANALEYSKRAVAIYEEYVSLDHLKGSSSYGNAVMLLGDCYSANGALDNALQCYKKILGSISNRDRLYDMVEATIGKSPDVDFKIKNYSEFVSLVPDNFMFNYRLGYLYGKEKNDLAKAVRYLQRAVELRPNEVDAVLALSHAYKLSKDYERAAFYLEQVVAMKPDDPSHLKKLLALYKLSGNQAKESDLTKRIEQLE
jgi:protein O-mannosyl-transferase